jgi:hypothetical protein
MSTLDIHTVALLVLGSLILLWRLGLNARLAKLINDAVGKVVDEKLKKIEESIAKNTGDLIVLRHNQHTHKHAIVRLVWTSANTLAFFNRPPRKNDIELTIGDYKSVIDGLDDYRRVLGKDDIDAT